MEKEVICIASNNRHKIEELEVLLKGRFELKTLSDIGCTEDIEETATTFEGNSLLKAQYVYDKYGYNCIADDSGLEVKALNGEPGVYSARYAGQHGNHEKNMDKLLKNLEPHRNKEARFRTVVTFISKGNIETFEGAVSGKIIDKKKGKMGFGYDPIFVPDGYDKTFAQMTMQEKNPISHRGRAIQKLIVFLNKKN